MEPGAFIKVSALGLEEQRVRVLIDISSPQAQWQVLGDGFRVSVRIVTLAHDNAVMVPVSAVCPLPAQAPGADAVNGAPAGAPPYEVFAAEGGRARVVPVVLADRSGSMGWLRSGLAPGASVIVHPPTTVRDGARVAPRKV